MPDFKPGSYVTRIGQPADTEAWRVMNLIPDSEKQLACLPASVADNTSCFFSPVPPLQHFALSEVEEALPSRYITKPRRIILVDCLYKTFAEFKRQVADEKQFDAFKEVLARFENDQLAGAQAQRSMKQAIAQYNNQPAHRQSWSDIWVNFVLDTQAPDIAFERLLTIFRDVTILFSQPERDTQ